MNNDPQASPGAALASWTTGTGPGKEGRLKPVLSLWALVLFGLAFVGPTAPYTFFGVGSVQSRGHFALVYLIAMLAVSFTAVSYGQMATAFPEAGSTYAYSSKAIHPVVGYLAGWVMILDYILMPMLCVIIVGVTSNKLLPAVPYQAWVIFAACRHHGHQSERHRDDLAGHHRFQRHSLRFDRLVSRRRHSLLAAWRGARDHAFPGALL